MVAPRTYTIFVSSPGDVADERERVHKVAREINERMSYQALRVLISEEFAAPGVGNSPQDVVDKYLEPYDIYLGIMWSRLGTPTPDEQSGTVHEYRQACRRLQRGERIEIMFYFGTMRLRPADGDQIERVNDFREEISRLGLVAFYDGLPDFADKLRTHLERVLKRLIADEAVVQSRGAAGDEVPAGADLIELRMRLEEKLTWLCKHFFGTPSSPAFATIGSLRRDGYLSPEQARVASRIMIGDAGAAEEVGAFRAAAESVVNAIRVTVLDAETRKVAEAAGWTVQDLAAPGAPRPDLLVRHASIAYRVAPRFTISASSKLANKAISRLRKLGGQSAGVTRRLVVVPGDHEPADTEDPAVVGIKVFAEWLANQGTTRSGAGR